MRIRQVKPDYWRDELMASLPDTVSLFYIGLWQEADDAGWLVWNIPEIGHDLYGYQGRQRREKWVKERGSAGEGRTAPLPRLRARLPTEPNQASAVRRQALQRRADRTIAIARDQSR